MTIRRQSTYRTIVIVIRILFAFSDVDGAIKQWMPNVNFENPVNWDMGHVPTFADTAVFPADTVVPIIIPMGDVSVCQMVLPATGQLILKPYADIMISASSADTCTGQTVTFKRAVPMEWVDPNNWSSERVNLATPHIERIPCAHDTVMFQTSHSFSIITPDAPITIGSMQLDNYNLNGLDLFDYISEHIGIELQSSSADLPKPNIEMTTTDCPDPAGCECGTLNLMDYVCKTATATADCAADRHRQLGCIIPVKPIGHCCRICGAYFLLSYGRNFDKKHLEEALKNDTVNMKSDFKNYQIFSYMSKLSNGQFQIVLVSGAKYVNEIDRIAKNVNSLLMTYIGSEMDVTNVEMFNSGLAYDVDSMTFGQLALTTCVIFLFSMVAIVLYYNHDWKSLKMFGSGYSAGAIFVKFENESNNVELVNKDVRLQRKSSFDNPTYKAVQENLSQSQDFTRGLSYANLAGTSSTSNKTMDVELTETSK